VIVAPIRVSVEHLDKSYGDVHVVQDVTFHIDAGEFVSLVGPSGCGKSTVLEMVGGLKAPDGGDILIDGSRVSGPRASTGIIFQEVSTLPWRTAQDNVALALEMRGVSKRQRLERANQALSVVGLGGFERHFPSQLSGGMRQRVALARALTMEPDVILADEPFGALDEQTRLVVALELLSVVERTSASVLFVTHSIQEAVLLSDRVLVMGARPGQIIDEVKIDLPGQRGPELIGSKTLSEYADRIWQPLRSEAQRALEMQGAAAR
jgi:NitT/TauT family transport system ATP-binding protein